MDPTVVKGIDLLIKHSEGLFTKIKETWEVGTENRIRDYLRSAFAKNSEVKTILHGSNPKPFYDIFFPLSITYKNRTYQDIRVNTLFRTKNYYVLMADAGSGKSMLFKHLFMQCIAEGLFFPIFLELRYLNDLNGDFLAFVFKHFENNNISSSAVVTDKLLKNGKFTIFLDGYDEIAKNFKSKVNMQVKSFNEKYPSNRVMISSRPYTNIEMLPNYHTLHICPLAEERKEISGFIQKQLPRDTELAGRIVKSIEEAKKADLQSFIRNPLLLSLYILTYQSSSEIPHKKSIFYRRVVHALFNEHDSKTKFGYVREKISNITLDQFEKTLKKFCIVSFFQYKLDFDFQYLRDTIEKVIKNDEDCVFSIEDFIEDLKLSFSLLIDDSGTLSFAHRSLQEYFAALYVKEAEESKKKEIYLKLLQKNGRLAFGESHNFLSILEELDTKDFYRFFYGEIIKKIDSLIDKLNYFDILKLQVKGIQIKDQNLSYYVTNREFNTSYFYTRNKYEMKVFPLFFKLIENLKQFGDQIADGAVNVVFEDKNSDLVGFINQNQDVKDYVVELQHTVNKEKARILAFVKAETATDEEIMQLI